ncbi:MAG: 3-isopropylmalate dehydrogenase [Crocinitomicaceae bacterium]|nr:3-isopropylmalate dehydrogenase [Crocinitomicaceae bacterium]
MKKQITLIKGDGIGPEITRQAIKVLDAVASTFQHDFKYAEVDMGACAIDKYGLPITDEGLETCGNSDAVLLGAIGDPKFDNDPTIKVRPEQGLLKLRKTLGLHSNIRPIKTYAEIIESSPVKKRLLDNVDFVIYRELIGGIYFGDKVLSEDEKTAFDLCEYTTDQIERITRKAFEGAQRRKKKVTLVDKANVLETSRLWRKTVAEIAQDYPDVELDYLFVDNAAMQIIQAPHSFDVILTENMFGDILSDLASVITGSIGMLPSASVGESNALFEPIHGSYPQAKGLDIANPMAMILSVAMMLDYFDLAEEASKVREAVEWALAKGYVTKDLHATDPMGCERVGEIISLYIESEDELIINSRNTEESRGVLI